MTKKLYYCIPTYKSFDLAAEGIHAAMRGSVKPDQIIVVDNSGNGQAAKYLGPLTDVYTNLYIWPQTYNIGVAASWNLFMNLPQDYIVIANDDVQVDTYTLERMVVQAQANPQYMFFSGDGASGNAFSLFLLTKKGFDIIGEFDTQFYPAYFEDNDYARRMLMKGQHIHFVSGATYKHDVSSTLKRYTPIEMDNHHTAFRANQAYYLRKWGGMPHQEIYDTAFNQ